MPPSFPLGSLLVEEQDLLSSVSLMRFSLRRLKFGTCSVYALYVVLLRFCASFMATFRRFKIRWPYIRHQPLRRRIFLHPFRKQPDQSAMAGSRVCGFDFDVD